MLLVPVNVFASSSNGTEGTVTFTGTALVEDYNTAGYASEVNSLQPGDSFSVTVNNTNNYDGNTAWYFSNSVLKTLEELSVAKNGAYTYTLAYNGTTIYDSSTVGGETVSSSGTGLYQATDALDEWFYIDTLKKGQSGQMILTVNFDGETQANNYMLTDAALQMKYAVGIIPEGVDTVEYYYTNQRIIYTGDNKTRNIYSYVAIGCGAIAIVLAFAVSKMKED
ncbi:MAG: hypothetical protein Q4D13_00165 [Erysipelotrichaceae bacterium]|nr:hypothetical protein [Erysipelotrichaceae bacterium]